MRRGILAMRVAGLAVALTTISGMSAGVWWSAGTADAQPGIGSGLAASNASPAALVPANLKSRGYVDVAVDPTFPPFAFYSGKNLVGLDVDLSGALTKVLGIKATPTPGSFSAFIPGLQSGRYNMAMASMADTAVREKTVDLVDYIKAAQSALFKASSTVKVTGLESFCGLKVAVQAGTAPVAFMQAEQQVCTSKGKGTLDLQQFPTQAAGVLAVNSGRVDTFLTATESVDYIAQQSHGALKVVGPQLGGIEDCGIGILKGSPLVSSVLSAMRELYSDGQLKSIYAKYGLASLLTRPTLDAATR